MEKEQGSQANVMIQGYDASHDMQISLNHYNSFWFLWMMLRNEWYVRASSLVRVKKRMTQWAWIIIYCCYNFDCLTIIIINRQETLFKNLNKQCVQWYFPWTDRGEIPHKFPINKKPNDRWGEKTFKLISGKTPVYSQEGGKVMEFFELIISVMRI